MYCNRMEWTNEPSALIPRVDAVADDEDYAEHQYLNDTVQAAECCNLIDNAPYYRCCQSSASGRE